MSKGIKFKDNTYLDVSSIVYNKQVLKTILDTNNKAENGYCKLPNGLILQWGVNYSAGITVQQYSKTINFPIAFPNDCLNVQLTLNDVGYGSNPLATGVGMTSRTKSNFVATFKDVRTSPPSINLYLFWFAIGY